MGEEVSAQEAFGTVAFDGVAHFFTGDKPHTILGKIATVKEDKQRGVPCFGSPFVDRIKLAGVSEAVEVF